MKVNNNQYKKKHKEYHNLNHSKVKWMKKHREYHNLNLKYNLLNSHNKKHKMK